MTNQKITVGVEIQSNTAKETTQAERLGAALKDAANSAQKIKVPAGGAATGVQGVMQRSQPVGAQAVMEYGQQRGTAGATGAAARDFARQSEGLGGLVRIYATYAANIYAAAAAFNALSRAMDTANMVKGLDQLGAATGTSLGGLSKELVKATDGAISLREAMSATVKVTSAGFDSETVLRLGNVARSASQALGVDMGDAISRLSRGITKLEPELLDELGLFTKLEKSTEEYAKSIGKSVSQLTDFEKRAAFANAVLTEGEKKFKSIKIDANPYSQLLASLQDLTTEGLNLINKVLAPIAKYLAASPTALTSVIGLLGIQLAKTTVPKLLEVKQAFDSISASSAKLATGKKNEAIKALLPEITEIRNAANASVEAFYNTLESSQAKALTLVKGKDKKKLTEIFGRGEEATAQDLAYIESVKKKAGANSALTASLNEYTRSLDGIITKENIYAEASRKSKEIVSQKYNLTKAVGQLQIIASSELQNARSKEIISNTAAITSTQGLSAGLKDLWTNTIKAAREQKTLTDTIEITTANGKTFTQTIDTIVPKMGMLKAVSTLTVGTFAALTTAVSTLGKALLTFLPYIGLAIGAFEVLNSFFSTSGKEQKAFQDAVDKSGQSIDNLKRTFDLIADKSFDEKFNTASLTASANAINEMNIATAGLTRGIIELNKNASTWDKFIDGFKIMFGGGARKEFAQNVTRTVVGALEAAYDSPQAKTAREKIANILQIDPDFTAKQFEQAIASAADSEDKLRALTAAMKGMGVELQSVASKSKDFDAAMSVSSKAYTDFTNQFALKDPLTLLALSFSESGAKLASLLEEPGQAIQKLFEISKDADKIKLFGAEDQANLRTYSKELEQTNTEYAKQKEALQEANKELDKQNQLLKDKRDEVRRSQGLKGATDKQIDDTYAKDIVKQVDAARRQQEVKQAAFNVAQQQAKELVDKFPNIAYNQIVRGSEILSASIGVAFSKAGTALGNAAVSILGDLPGTAKLQEQIANRQIDAQNKLQEATLNLLRGTNIATQQQKVSDAKKAVSDYELQVSLQKAAQLIATGTATPPEGYEAEKKKLTDKVKEQEGFLAAYSEPNSKKALGLANGIADANKENKEVLAEVAALQKFIAQQAGIQAAIAEGLDQKRANALQQRVKTLAEENKFRQEGIDRDIEKANRELQGIARIEKQAGFLTSEQIARENIVKGEILSNQQLKEELDLKTKIQALEEARKTIDFDAKGKPTGAKGAEDRVRALKALEDAKKDLPNKFQSQAAQQAFENQQKLNAQKEREVAFDLKITNLNRERNTVLDDTIQQTLELNAATRATVLPLSPQYMAMQDAYVKSRRDQMLNERELNKLAADFNTAQDKLRRERQNLGTGTEFAARRAEIDRELEADKALFEAKRAQLISLAELTRSTDTEKLAYNLKQLDFAERLDKVTDSVKGLGDAFGDFGSKIGSAVTMVTEFNIAQEKSADKLKSLRDEIADQRDAQRPVDPKLIKEESKLTEKARKDEISGYAKMAGAAKNMFKEKTGAYKAFAAVEKALATYRLLMDAQKIASELGVTAAAVAGSATRAAAAVPEAVGNAVVGITAQAKGDPYTAFPRIAAMTALMAGILAAIGGSVGGGGGGKKSFTPSAAQRQETQGTAMGYDSAGKQIQTREGVFGDTSAKSESIANSLEIIKNNSVAGLSYNDQLLKAFESLNNTMKDVAKSVYAVSGIRTGSGFGTQEGTIAKGGFFGIGGKSVSKEITDAGIQLKGTFLELARGTGGVINQFETLTTTTTKKGFLGIGGSTRVNVSTQFKDLDPKAAEAIGDALGQGYQTIMQAGIETGLSPERIDQLLSGVKVDELASLRGLKGEELQTELNAVIGSILDDAAGATFESFKQFREFGEGMLETVVRVIDTNKKVKQVLSNLSGSVQNVDFKVSEQMVKMAGGLEAFIEQSDSFSENFLTEQERLAPKQKAVRDELGRLGLSWVTTRKQFKDVVQSLIDTGQAGSQTYADLMKLNKNFAEITPEIENLSKSLEELKNDLKSTAEQRISDLKSARDGFEQFSKSIRDYQQSLKTGALSPLTPGQKYLENKRQFEQLSALAKTDTKEGADARSKLQGAASSLLESSRTMFASSDAYTQDFGSVQAALDSAAAYGDEQVKKANESIDLVKQQVQGLVDLKDSVDRLPEPISAGVGSAVTTALASFRTASDPEAQKAAEAAKNQRDQMAVSYAAQIAASEALKRAADAFAAAGNNYSSVTSGYTAAATTGSGSILNAQPDAATWFSGQNWYMETGATGSNYIPEDMPLYVHQGERLMPAADNKQLMKMVNEYSGGGGGELYDEVCRLTKQVEVLTKVVADGAVVNAQATDRNTDELTKTFQDISEKAAYVDKLKNRTSIV